MTLNDTDAIDPARILGRYRYAHPVFTRRGRRARRSAGPRSTASTHLVLRRVLGATVSTRTAWQSALRVGTRRSGCDRGERAARSTRARCATGVSRRCARLPLPAVHAAARPRALPTRSPAAGCGRLGARRRRWFRRADFLGDPALPLADCVRELVAQRTGRRPAGPVRLLTNLRYLGLLINPSALLLLRRRRRALEAVVPRSPTRHGASVTPTCCPPRPTPACCTPLRQGLPRLAVHSDGHGYHWAAGPRRAARRSTWRTIARARCSTPRSA